MTFMFGLPLQLRSSVSYHLVCWLSITSCYLLQYSLPLVTLLLLHEKQRAESWPPCCLGIPAPYRARAFPLLCIIFGLSLHLSPVCILTLVFIELPRTFQWLLLGVHIARGWQTALICFYKLQKFRSLALTLWDRLASTVTQLDVGSIQSKAGSAAVLWAKSINIRGIKNLMPGWKITIADYF